MNNQLSVTINTKEENYVFKFENPSKELVDFFIFNNWSCISCRDVLATTHSRDDEINTVIRRPSCMNIFKDSKLLAILSILGDNPDATIDINVVEKEEEKVEIIKPTVARIPLAYKEKVDKNNRYISFDDFKNALSTERCKELFGTIGFPCLREFKTFKNIEDATITDPNEIFCRIRGIDFEKMVAVCEFKHAEDIEDNMKVYFAYLSQNLEFTISEYTQIRHLIALYGVVSSKIANPYE